MTLENGKSKLALKPIVMETDASTLGWEQFAVAPRCLRSQAECQHLINCTSAMFVVKAIMKDKRNFHILLMMDNRTAVFYVICMEGTHFQLTSQLAIQVVSREEPFPISSVLTRGIQLCSR